MKVHYKVLAPCMTLAFIGCSRNVITLEIRDGKTHSPLAEVNISRLTSSRQEGDPEIYKKLSKEIDSTDQSGHSQPIKVDDGAVFDMYKSGYALCRIKIEGNCVLVASPYPESNNPLGDLFTDNLFEDRSATKECIPGNGKVNINMYPDPKGFDTSELGRRIEDIVKGGSSSRP